MRLLISCFVCSFFASSQTQRASGETIYLLKPAHVFDGESAQLHDNWVVLVRGEKIEAVGPASSVNAPAGAKVIDLPGLTLMPGLIEAHSHVLLHPYSRNRLERSGGARVAEPARRASDKSPAQHASGRFHDRSRSRN